jgi:DNA ligase-associated metallophosphoesterase
MLELTLGSAELVALPSGGLYWPAQSLLCVSDLHLGKSERLARRGGALLPPYEGAATLAKLRADIAQYQPKTLICLGDSFDDMVAAAGLPADLRHDLADMQTGRRWIWIAGNHDAAPVLGMGGANFVEWALGEVVFRHSALPDLGHYSAEISGHYHPKARLAGQSLPAFWQGAGRLILPSFGVYTGGLLPEDAPITPWLGPAARAMVCRAGRILALPLAGARPKAFAPRRR